MKLITPFLASILFGITASVCAGGFSTHVPMTLKGSKTFYVSGRMAGIESAEFMVDTGSSYMTINQATLDKLQTDGQVVYLRDLTGVLANGEELVVPVYRIPRMILGNSCELSDVEAAVFPGNTRQILGLSVLRRTAPFMFSIDPPGLHLSNCNQQVSQAAW
jgi:predicted aspartyl protease